ncbi:fumarate reductase subunit D [Saccharothrix sp. ALI-22-I]|uniref:fumarate reductase subunit FrdD n=1 Tax=Saccharothrix sp. ALI-22-I TaxID=1933778 RepID=UPI00097BFBF6|nr:fumarate reductase subunit FrdD [Saccharothrix sp. ALI-22-I]ONI87725.1 fumarate reductase subunit D [Saccharothrix sp. ALI-22-I]
MRRRSPEPLVWLLFSAGGMAAALAVPVLLFLFGVAFPLGWLPSPDHAHLLSLLRSPITKVVLFGLCVLALFHWAHRFRYTLYDGLRLKKLSGLIILLCYGGALVGSAIAGYVLLRA